MLVTESHLVVPLQLVIVPGRDEDIHWVPDHGDVDRLAGVTHPLADQVVFEPGVEEEHVVGHVGILLSDQVPLVTFTVMTVTESNFLLRSHRTTDDRLL